MFVRYLIRFGKIPTLLVVNTGRGFSVDLGNVVMEVAEPSLPGWCRNIWYTLPVKRECSKWAYGMLFSSNFFYFLRPKLSNMIAWCTKNRKGNRLAVDSDVICFRNRNCSVLFGLTAQRFILGIESHGLYTLLATCSSSAKLTKTCVKNWKWWTSKRKWCFQRYIYLIISNRKLITRCFSSHLPPKKLMIWILFMYRKRKMRSDSKEGSNKGGKNNHKPEETCCNVL